MSRSKARLQTALKLQAIERARKITAEMRLSDARSAADLAQRQQSAASDALRDAEAAWIERLAGRRLNLELQLGFAGLILSREGEHAALGEEKVEAERILDQRRSSWQELEASVRSGDQLLRRWRRDLARRSAESGDQELADRTSWKWYRR